MATIEVTQEMVEAGIDAINKLRMIEAEQTGNERIEMSWADLLSAAYAAMEACRQRQLAIYAALANLPHRGLVT